MSTKDNYTKTLRFSAETDEKLGEAAARLGLSKFRFFNLMVDYFYRTRKDPADVNDEVLKKTLFRNHDTYVRFIRAQEDRILIPLKEEMDRMVASQIKIIDSFNNQVLKANREILSGQDTHSRQVEQMIGLFSERLDDKEGMKQKFRYILNHFYKAMIQASAREKEALLLETLEHIAKL